MHPEPELDTAKRMRDAHATATATLLSQPHGLREAWGWRGRTLSGPVTSSSGEGWLRLVCAPADKASGKIWEGRGFTPVGRHGFAWLCGECQGS
jgi:hypothetical protein